MMTAAAAVGAFIIFFAFGPWPALALSPGLPSPSLASCFRDARRTVFFARDPSWIKDAMGDEFNPDPEQPAAPLSLKEGLAGFAVDPTLGFIAVVAGPSASSNGPAAESDASMQTRWVYAVVSPQDKSQITSAEAQTLVQLAGGIDLGTAILPPEALTRIARDELDDEDYEEGQHEQLFGRANLVGVEAVRKKTSSPVGRETEILKKGAAPLPSSTKRDAKIESDAPRLHSTIQKLPGCNEATPEFVRDAMQLHADASGAIDREGFTNILDTLRRGVVGGDDHLRGVDFVMTLDIDGGDGEQVRVKAPNNFLALGLAMRYSAPITISADCLVDDDSAQDDNSSSQIGGCGIEDLLTKFPAFRPMQELLEDAQTVDGFISHMFYKQNAPKAFE